MEWPPRYLELLCVPDTIYTVPRDIPDDMNPQLLTALLASLQTGQISYDTFWRNLQKGEIAPTDRDADEERALINQQDTGFTDE